ncbi:MAG: hypothetical protein N4A65_00365 [Cohaesibacter sp.]|nr:hypothetical protein [Cohaesibacter sp.]
MTTLDDLKQEIADDLERPDLIEAIGDEVDAAIKHFRVETFHFTEDADWPKEAFDLLRGRAGRKVCVFKIRDFELAYAYEQLEADSLLHLRRLKEQDSETYILKGAGL